MDIFETPHIFFIFIFAFFVFLVIVFLKKFLFWLYLWQLKEYHLGRFIDHFSTAKGKELLLNRINLLKFFFLFVIIYSYLLSDDPANAWLGLFILSLLSLFFIYTAEGLKALKDFFQKTLKKPIFTKKITFLFSITVIAAAIFFYFTIQKIVLETILIFDLLIPLIVSAVVLLFQPLAVLGRNQIIKKAKKKREQYKNLLVVGITGSYGKTSTKEFLSTILEEKFPGKVLKTRAHQNSEVGISQCILNDLKEEHEIFVCEMGAYNRGGIKLLCDIVKPKIGVLTGINEQHMATFGSQENIIKAKYELVENLPEDGTAFFNERNKYCLWLYHQTTPSIKKFLYGKEARFFGEENILGAMAVAKEFGMTDEEISKAAAKIKNRFGGIAQKETTSGLKIIDATYSANPDGVIAHLEHLKTLPGKKVIVMPCLIELGSASVEVHERIGRKIGEVCDLAIITTRDKFKEIREAVLLPHGEGGRETKILFLENPNEIYEKIKSFSCSGDTILLESRLPDNLIKKLLNENI